MKIDQEKIKKIRSGVEKYKEIMKRYRTANVAEDRELQRLYNGFYRVRQRKQKWYEHYYRMLEGLKVRNLSFGKILIKLKQRTGRVEASFASKMYATRNPKFPIIDQWVLKCFGLTLPGTYATNRIKKIIEKYGELVTCYQNIMSSNEGVKYIEEFDKICPGTNITDMKKIDFILWQKRRDN